MFLRRKSSAICKDFSNGVEYLTNIRGRSSDAVVLEDGRSFGFHPFYVVTEKLEDVINFRVIQTTYHDITFEVVAASKDVDTSDLESKICTGLEKIITNYDMRYHFIWKGAIEADANGKCRFIVNKLSS